jgi:hypothetical protein
MGVRDKPRPLPDAAPPGARARRNRERAVTRASRCRGRFCRPEPHDAALQADLWIDADPVEGPHSRLVDRTSRDQWPPPIKSRIEPQPVLSPRSWVCANSWTAAKGLLVPSKTEILAEPMLDKRFMYMAWTCHGRRGGRRRSNPQLQPSEGDGPFFVFRRAR